MNTKLKLFALLVIACTLKIYAGTTGKIYGNITSAESGDPIPGISIRVVGTDLGAATNNEGNYFIINVPPGKYKLEAGGIGYKSLKKEGFWVSVDKSTQVDFELANSGEYVLTEQQEQFYLQKFSDGQTLQLLKLKEQDKLEYQRELVKMYFKPPGDSEDATAAIYENILQHTKQIDKLGEEYKRQDNDEAKKKIQQDMMNLLEERFTLQEKKMQFEIQKLSEGIENLQKELKKFRADKELILQKQFEGFVD